MPVRPVVAIMKSSIIVNSGCESVHDRGKKFSLDLGGIGINVGRWLKMQEVLKVPELKGHSSSNLGALAVAAPLQMGALRIVQLLDAWLELWNRTQSLFMHRADMAGDAGFGEIMPEPSQMRGNLVPEGQEDHADATSEQTKEKNEAIEMKEMTKKKSKYQARSYQQAHDLPYGVRGAKEWKEMEAKDTWIKH
ncbi:hypothetical protein BT96DRAFT_945205 [Gymnopus androsaceus JB14]|uniref:Uncharacterized protein n=1 Tax=Gymnopus androsaceus JB14 TaxID=1447944 RepID=A0A6A4H0C0_9AGAR|nr:hypothetical protein BT96DRAFT_945205 [Gymnopus androsaceus JB14]